MKDYSADTYENTLQLTSGWLYTLGIAPVAQLDRASVYGTEGHGFESSRARQFLKPRFN